MSYGIPTCDRDGCKGHLAKFDSCVAEAIWQASMTDTDATTGDTDTIGHFALMIFPESEEIDISDAEDGTDMVTVPAGAYILHTLTTGQVILMTYETESGAREEFERLETEYDALDDGEE